MSFYDIWPQLTTIIAISGIIIILLRKLPKVLSMDEIPSKRVDLERKKIIKSGDQQDKKADSFSKFTSCLRRYWKKIIFTLGNLKSRKKTLQIGTTRFESSKPLSKISEFKKKQGGVTAKESIDTVSKETGKPRRIFSIRKAALLDKVRRKITLIERSKSKRQEQITYLFKKAKDLIKEKKFSDVEKVFIEIICLNPKNSKAYKKLGKFYLYRDNFKDARDSFKQVIKLEKFNRNYWLKLGDAFEKMGDLKGALDIYKRAFKINKDFIQAYIRAADILEKLKDKKKAIFYYKEIVDLNPKRLDIFRKIAELSLEIKDKNIARESLQKILNTDPSNSYARDKLRELKGEERSDIERRSREEFKKKNDKTLFT
ncbi:hypothetical protein COY23_01630 [bacterium (Candidatus Torokbacteria) CG_4_10_14_0_2_um_filter_35_8]|nr:MAG: hypothetical protein COY23_01630 [bacterium (Candidatus Torokbacteria) CG_4_10_14_0_2_um_filter_35_8]